MERSKFQSSEIVAEVVTIPLISDPGSSHLHLYKVSNYINMGYQILAAIRNDSSISVRYQQKTVLSQSMTGLIQLHPASLIASPTPSKFQLVEFQTGDQRISRQVYQPDSVTREGLERLPFRQRA
jgi:hypothetical protein